MRLEAISKWAKNHGVNIERVNIRRVDVFRDGTAIECYNLQEIIDAVVRFIR